MVPSVGWGWGREGLGYEETKDGESRALPQAAISINPIVELLTRKSQSLISPPNL